MPQQQERKKELSVRHLLSTNELTYSDFELIFQVAKEFKEGVLKAQIKKTPALQGYTIANLFFENSTRTRISFELAQKRLSADTVNLSASTSSINKGETILDTVENIRAMKVDMMVIRHSQAGVPYWLSQQVDAAIINAGDGAHQHPTQALLDAFTIHEELGKIRDKKITIVGDILHSRVAMSNIYAFKKLGAKVCVCAPKTLLQHGIESLGVDVSHHLPEAVHDADIIYVLRVQVERQNQRSYFPSVREYHANFGINMELLKSLPNRDTIKIMHPGPINRGVEISPDVADALPHSLILDQVENGVSIRMAVLYLLSRRLQTLG